MTSPCGTKCIPHTEPIASNFFLSTEDFSLGLSACGTSRDGSNGYGYNRRVPPVYWGERVKEVREALGLSQVQVAADSKSTLTANYISKIENGHETNPTLELITDLARGCSVAPFVLVMPKGSSIPGGPATKRRGKQTRSLQPEPTHGRTISPDVAFARLAESVLALSAELAAAVSRARGDSTTSGVDAEESDRSRGSH